MRVIIISMDAIPPFARRGDLPRNSAAVLSALRHMIISWPCAGSARAALIDAFGDDATGIEHLLRCIVTGIGMYGQRVLRIGIPACTGLLPDEIEILEAIGLDGAEPDPSALSRLCASPKGERLAPLADMLNATAARAGQRNSSFLANNATL